MVRLAWTPKRHLCVCTESSTSPSVFNAVVPPRQMHLSFVLLCLAPPSCDSHRGARPGVCAMLTTSHACKQVRLRDNDSRRCSFHSIRQA